MAEAVAVFSFVASVASLIDIGVKVAARIHEFSTRTSEVPETFRSLAKRLPLLTETLKIIKRQADAGRLPAEVSIALLSLIQSTLTQLRVVETCMLTIIPSSDASRLHKAVKALKSLTKDGKVRIAVEKLHQDINLLTLHQTTQHVEVSDQILAALAQLQQGQVQTLPLLHNRGHSFGNVIVNDHASVQLGDVYHVYQHSEVDTLKVFGLCLNSAPSIEHTKFIGRARELQEMVQILQPGEPSVEQRRMLLGGLGGMGKTQLAIAYARQHHASYTSVLWLNATSKLTLLSSIRSIAKTLLTESSTKELDDEEALTDMFEWLADERNTQWLLIYDNYDDPSQYTITEYMPGTSNGTIIVTTRLPDLVQGQRIQRLRLLPIEDLDESVKILESRSQRGNVRQDPDAYRLAKRLAGLPLALATAGAYLRKRTLTFHEYLEAYEQRFNINPRRTDNLEEYADRTLHTTWDLTYRQLEDDDMLAAKILKLLAYFDNQEIWFELLHAGIRNDCPDWLQEVAGDHIEFENVMGTLVDYCLIEAQPTTRSYSMHNCVHDWTLAQLNKVKSAQLFWYATECVVSSVDKDDWKFVGQLRYSRLARHALRCSREQFQQFTSAETVSVDGLTQITLIADILRHQIQYSAAEQMYLRAMIGQEESLGADHDSTLETVNNLGMLYYAQGKLDQAEQIYHRTLVGREKTLGPNHVLTLVTIHNLGTLYQDQGRLDDAEQMYLRALAGKEKVLEPDDTSILQTISNLGAVYYLQGKFDEAEQMYQRALIGCEEVFGPDHSSTLQKLNNLGILYFDQNKLDKAEQMYQRVLVGYEKLLGPKHISTLEILNNLGILYRAQGKLGEAKKMHERALVEFEETLGCNHIITLETVNNLGILYRAQGKLDDSEQMYQRAFAGFKEAFGLDHTSTLNTINNLGILHWSQDKLGDAEQMLKQALAGYERILGPDHPSTLDAVHNLGLLYRSQDKLDEAELMYQRALAGYEKSLGPEHPKTRRVMDYLSSTNALWSGNSLGVQKYSGNEH